MNDKNAVIDRMSKRDEERIDKLQRTQKAKEEVQSTDEQAEYFERAFQEKSTHIQELFAKVPTLQPHKFQDHFKQAKKDINDLQKYVASSSLFLKEFNMRKYLKMVQDLQAQCYELEEKYTPRKKFGFSRKTAVKVDASKRDKIEPIDIPDGKPGPRLYIDENFFGFALRQNEYLKLNSDELYQRDVTLKNLSNCTISLQGNMGTLHMSELSNCVILCGPVDTSVFVNKCIQCKIAVLCQQLRMHYSESIDVYLHVTCKGIIEDCKNIRSAPYTLQYEELAQHKQKSSLDLKSNNWNTLDDFNWLSTDFPSPNWKVMEESNRIQDWSAFSCHIPSEVPNLFV